MGYSQSEMRTMREYFIKLKTSLGKRIKIIFLNPKMKIALQDFTEFSYLFAAIDIRQMIIFDFIPLLSINDFL